MGAGPVELDNRRRARSQIGVQLALAAIAVDQAPPLQRHRGGGAVADHHRFVPGIRTGGIEQGPLQICRPGGRRTARCRPDQPRQGLRGRRRIAVHVRRHPLGLEGQQDPDHPVREGEQKTAVVECAVVSGVGADVALVHVDVVNPVQTVRVSEFGVDRLVQIAVELRAEGVELPAGRLALRQVQAQQILQIIGIRTATRRQCPAQAEFEQRCFHVVQRGRRRGRGPRVAGRHRGQSGDDRMTDQRIHHPEHDLAAVVGLHVDRDPPRLSGVVHRTDLQVRGGLPIFADEAVRPGAQDSVGGDRHDRLLVSTRAQGFSGTRHRQRIGPSARPARVADYPKLAIVRGRRRTGLTHPTRRRRDWRPRRPAPGGSRERRARCARHRRPA